MKKMNLILSGSLLVMSLGVLSPAVVYAGAETETAQEDENGEMSWVFDDCGILSDDEITELNDELATIYDTYGYDAVLWISQDVGEDEDYRQYAAEFMQANEIGYGDTHEGMCIFHQQGVRNITIVFRGDTQNEFSTRIQDEMLDKCKTYLKDDDPFGGYQSLIHDLEAGLDRISEGENIRLMDLSDEAVGGRFVKDLLICDHDHSNGSSHLVSGT